MPWHVSQPGPDWTDIRSLMEVIEKNHAATCYLHMSPLGKVNGVEWRIVAVVHLMGMWMNPEKSDYGVAVNWPNLDSATLEGAVYALLVKLDWDLESGQFQGYGKPS